MITRRKFLKLGASTAVALGTPQAIAQIYLDVVDAVKPDLSIIDFSIGMEGNELTSGSGATTVDMRDRLGSWLVVASTDIMAADATVARIMNHDVGHMKQLGIGYEMGLGGEVLLTYQNDEKVSHYDHEKLIFILDF